VQYSLPSSNYFLSTFFLNHNGLNVQHEGHEAILKVLKRPYGAQNGNGAVFYHTVAPMGRGMKKGYLMDDFIAGLLRRSSRMVESWSLWNFPPRRGGA